MKHRLRVLQALWAMQGISAPDDLEGVFDRVKAAGFDGMAIDLGALSWDQAVATLPHFKRTGLSAGLTAFPKTDVELVTAIGLAKRLEAPCLVVIGQDMPVGLDSMVQVIERWLKLASSHGLPLQFETHRNCITNDLYTTIELLEAVPGLRLAADLSHYVVDREMPAQPSVAMQNLVSQILARSDSFQGRVAARGQIQIPLHFPHNQKWVTLFKSWWLEGFQRWLSRQDLPERDLVFLCELGPPDYALTDSQGREFSDRWQESLELMQWARQLWRDASVTVA